MKVYALLIYMSGGECECLLIYRSGVNVYALLIYLKGGECVCFVGLPEWG